MTLRNSLYSYLLGGKRVYLIKEVSRISGVSVRTLHHYDKIGLLCPERYDNGYRYYSEEDISLLQTILFYKYLGFSLKQIKDLLEERNDGLIVHLRRQLKLLKEEKNKLLTLIGTLEKTILSEERRTIMSAKEKFNGFTYEENQKYKQDAIEKYGGEVINEAIKKQKGKEKEVTDGFNNIFFAFSENMANGLEATSKENIKLSKALHEHICKYSFDCSSGVFSKIAYGYVKNGEFKKNLDKFGKGTAQYVCDSVQKYVSEM